MCVCVCIHICVYIYTKSNKPSLKRKINSIYFILNDQQRHCFAEWNFNVSVNKGQRSHIPAWMSVRVTATWLYNVDYKVLEPVYYGD